MTSDQKQNNFKFIFLGQSVLSYRVPLDIFGTINQIYEERINELYPANKQLVGKIENEHSLFFDGPVRKVYNPYIEKIPERIKEKYGHIRF